MREFDSAYVDKELEAIGVRVKKPVTIYLIGGCAMSFRGLKEATKDVDIVFRSRRDFDLFCYALFGAQYFEPGQIIDEYAKLKASKMFENKDGFHLDLFVKRVCAKLKLSKGMAGRSEFFKKHGNLETRLVSKEDIFLFKSIASEGRIRDLDDMRVIYPGMDWKIVEAEIADQKLSRESTEVIRRRLEAFREKFGLDVPLLKKL